MSIAAHGGRASRRFGALIGIATAIAVGGCATPYEARVDASRFAPPAAVHARPSPARVTVVVVPTVADQVYTGEPLADAGRRAVRLPIGRIVEAAAAAAFRAAFDGSADAAAGPGGPDAGDAARVEITALQFDYTDRLVGVVPVPLPPLILFPINELSVALAFELRLVDAAGRTIAARRYDNGRVVWPRPWLGGEQPVDGVVRLAHEAAWQQAQRAARDVGDWLDAERVKPRRL